MTILDQGPDGGVYLGDGVYCKFDGTQLCLITGDHRNVPAVYLEPQVFAALIRVARQINNLAGQDYFPLVGREGVSQS